MFCSHCAGVSLLVCNFTVSTSESTLLGSEYVGHTHIHTSFLLVCVMTVSHETLILIATHSPEFEWISTNSEQIHVNLAFVECNLFSGPYWKTLIYKGRVHCSLNDFVYNLFVWLHQLTVHCTPSSLVCVLIHFLGPARCLVRLKNQAILK